MMPAMPPNRTVWQRQVDAHFAAAADFWDEVYERGDGEGRRYKTRLERALAWVDAVALPAGTHALDLGAGAGSATVELARRGFTVDAIDSVPAMATRIKERAARFGVVGRVRARVADARALPYPDESFDLVMALGVVPWLDQPRLAIAEIARVLKPGGWLVVSCANRAALCVLIEPMYNPMLAPARRFVAATLRRIGWRKTPEHGPRPRLQSLRSLTDLLVSAGLVQQGWQSYGFGPLSFLNQRFPDRLGLWLDQRLQAAADAKIPFVRSAGVGFLVLAQRALQPTEGKH
jgi:ubiquinone/menaquinone biosynthesis C-methylase UbiE